MPAFYAYPYVGPERIRSAAAGAQPGTVIGSADALAEWLEQNPDALAEGATYVVDLRGRLRVAPRRSEHVACASADPLLAAGEFTSGPPPQSPAPATTRRATPLTSTAYRARARAARGRARTAARVLSGPIVFRRFPRCREINVVKGGWFVCALCDADLPEQWNVSARAWRLLLVVAQRREHVQVLERRGVLLESLPAATSRKSRRMIFPERVLGSASAKRISSGRAMAPISLRHVRGQLLLQLASRLATPFFSVTNATSAVPLSSSGRPTTAASATARCAHQRALDLGGAEAMAGDVHHVVHAAHQPEVAVLVRRAPSPVKYMPGQLAEVRLLVALLVPHTVRSIDGHGPRDEQQPALPVRHRLARRDRGSRRRCPAAAASPSPAWWASRPAAARS